MNLYEVGKDLQQIIASAASIDRQLSSASCEHSAGSPERNSGSTTFPCKPKPVEDDFNFTTVIGPLTVIAPNARNNDVIIEAVSKTEVTDAAGQSLGNSIYLVNSKLQGLLELAYNLNSHLGPNLAQVDLCYGLFSYNGSPLPIIYGISLHWSPSPNDYRNAGAGLIISLQAKLDEKCNIKVDVQAATSASDPGVFFRMGNVGTIEKLNIVALAYFKSQVQKTGVQQLVVDSGVLNKIQLD
jgi:hypothetical protein